MLELVTRFIRDEEGQGLAEYGLILAVVAIFAVAALVLLREQISEIFSDVADKLAERP